ncbi:MAG: DUF4097 family beta strand repeat-containing protein [Clostridia bacterium]|nr:DUF4097 family beta strand repeat-containing protein [Clostridia bacterium]
MNKATKVWITVATVLVVAGFLVFAVAMTANNWEFAKVNTDKFETNTYEVNEEFSAIAMKTKTADIIFTASDDGKCKVVCYETEKWRHSVAVENNTLTVNMADEKQWYEYIGMSIGTPKITVYLPKNEYASLFIDESTGDIEIPKNFKFNDIDITLSTGDITNYASASENIKIKASTGAVRVEGISANTLDITTSTGKVTVSGAICENDVRIKVSTGRASITDINCNNFITNGSTGNITLKNVIASEKLSAERSTGDVIFDGCDAAEIYVETDTGNVKGSLLTEKVFIVRSDTGRIDVPKTITGGRCEITTDTGNIIITIG